MPASYFFPPTLPLYMSVKILILKEMKKIVLFVALIGALVSCKKSNSGSSGYHVTASVDGAAKAFNTAPLATKLTNTSTTQITVDGFATGGGESISLIIDNAPSGKPIVAGTYTDTTSDFEVALFYTQNLTAAYAGGTTVAAGLAIQNHVKIVITSIDTTSSIKGSFSGDLFLNGDVTAAKKTFTNGDFYVKFH